ASPTDIYSLSLHDALPISQRQLQFALDQKCELLVRRRPRVFSAHAAGLDRDQRRLQPSAAGCCSEGRDLRMGPLAVQADVGADRSEEHTSELQSPYDLVCR